MQLQKRDLQLKPHSGTQDALLSETCSLKLSAGVEKEHGLGAEEAGEMRDGQSLPHVSFKLRNMLVVTSRRLNCVYSGHLTSRGSNSCNCHDLSHLRADCPVWSSRSIVCCDAWALAVIFNLYGVLIC